MSNEIESKVRALIKDNIELIMPIENIDSEQDLIKLGMDSINSIKIIVAIEREFAFEDEDLNYENFQNIKTIISYIERRILNDK